MSRFLYTLKQNLYGAQAKFSQQGNAALAGAMGSLAEIADSVGKLIKDKDLTPSQELQHFRRALNDHIDFVESMDDLNADDVTEARKIIETLTETD